MTNQQLASRARRVARRKYIFGRIDRATFVKVIKACESDEIVAEWNRHLQLAGVSPPAIQGEGDELMQGAFLDWFMENWPKILEILLAILPLFLGDER